MERRRERGEGRGEGFMISWRGKTNALHVFLLSFQRFCGSRVKTWHPHLKKGGTTAQRQRGSE